MRNETKIISFDADDTLWVNMSFYFEAVEKIKEIFGRYIDMSSIPKDVYRIETANVSTLGYGTKSFIISMIEAGIRISSQNIEANDIQEIISIGKTLISSPVVLLDNVENVLKNLSSKFQLMLLTKGDLFEQQSKIDRSGLSDYFCYVEIVSKKNERTYSEILQKYDILPKNFLMIGNSLKSDILPVINVGGNAVYIPHEDAWYHEQISHSDREEKYYKIDSISNLPEIIAKILI
jgi:putative hydrolase of the HAD superfamily